MTNDERGADRDGPPFAAHRRYYLFLKVAIALFAFWLVLHFTGIL